jgi:adenosylhomocysteine nucleosidase
MNKKDILIVCALEEETNGKLDGWNVIYTGVGKVNATHELTAELFFQMKLSKTPELVINFGTAGSREIPIHTLVDCNQFIQRDMDATGLGFFKGQTPFEDELIIDFSYINNSIGKGYVCGSGDNFVDNIDNEIDHIDVFDMEAYALAKVCYKTGIDFVSYKYITDNVNEKSANDWKENCGKGIKEFKKLIEECYLD